MTSPSTVAPVSTSLMSFDGTIASTIHNTRQSSAWHDRTANRRSASCGDESQRTSISQCGQETRNQHSELTAKGVSRQDSTSQVIKSVFVQGVGWASQVSTPLESFFLVSLCTLCRLFLRRFGQMSEKDQSIPFSCRAV